MSSNPVPQSGPTSARLPNPIHQSEMELKDIVLILRRRRVIILAAVAVGIVVAATSVLLAHKEYTSAATIEINRGSDNSLGLADLSGISAGLGGEDEMNMDLLTEQSVIMSDNTALKVIEELKLDQAPPYAIPAPENGKITVHYYDSNGQQQHVIGDSLVIAIPPTLDNLQKIGLNLQQQEYNVFKSMQVVPGYYGFSFTAQQNFQSISNVNTQDPLGELDVELAPVPLFFCDFGNTSLCNGFAISAEPLNTSDMADRITHQMEIMSLLTPTPVDLSVVEVISHTGYFPHPTAQVLQQNPGYYGNLNALQGTTKTFWIGAGPSTAATTITIEHGHLLRQQFFPAQGNRRELPARTWSKIDFSKPTAAYAWPRQ